MMKTPRSRQLSWLSDCDPRDRANARQQHEGQYKARRQETFVDEGDVLHWNTLIRRVWDQILFR
jgi:hypothetical protein